MAPSLDEVLLGLGSAEVTFDYWPDLAEVLADYHHLIFYRRGKPFGPPIVILDRTPSREGIIVSGLGAGWWLSVDNEGSIIEDREYIAGNHQLSNGGFERLDARGFPILWSTKDGSRWRVITATPHAGAHAMKVTGPFAANDVLTSSEPRPVRPGALVRTEAWVRRVSGDDDRTRVRTTYEGRFDPPDLLETFDLDVDWTNISEFPDDVEIIDSYNAILGPVTQKQAVVNGNFETGTLDNWIEYAGSWLIFNSPTIFGFYSVGRIADGVNSLALLESDRVAGPPPNSFPVAKGERWRLEGWTMLDSVDSVVPVEYKGAAWITAGLYRVDSSPIGFHDTDKVDARGVAGGAPQLVKTEFDVPDEAAGVVVWLVADHLAGTVYFDNVYLVRIKGNTAKLRSPEFDVVPERSYKLLGSADGSWPASGPTRNGTLQYLVTLRSSSGRADLPILVLASGGIDVSQAANRMVLDQTVKPPAGYDRATVTIVATDLAGGNVIVHKPTMTDEDETTSVVDRVIGPAASATWTKFTVDSTAPEGTEKVHVEVVGEALLAGSEWDVDDVTWYRREATTSIRAIVMGLLRDVDTGEYLVEPGVIHPSGLPAWDWLLTNEPARSAFIELLRGGRVVPAQEWRHNADNTIDVGLPGELFEVRPITFTEPDLLLLSPYEVKLAVEDRLTAAKVFGARLKRPAPRPDAVIVGTYETTIPGAVDWYGRPVRRTRIITDTAVTFAAYADARAQAEVEKSAAVADKLAVDIADWSAWGALEVGDWCAAYKPEALWEDRTNPQVDERTGRRIFPKLSRLLARKLTMARGDGFAIKVRKADGTVVDVSRFVQWAPKTTARLELGEELVDIVNDPQGPAAGVAYVRDRAREDVG